TSVATAPPSVTVVTGGSRVAVVPNYAGSPSMLELHLPVGKGIPAGGTVKLSLDPTFGIVHPLNVFGQPGATAHFVAIVGANPLVVVQLAQDVGVGPLDLSVEGLLNPATPGPYAADVQTTDRALNVLETFLNQTFEIVPSPFSPTPTAVTTTTAA